MALHKLLYRRLLSTAQHSTAQLSTAQHSTAQHSTAQHSTAQHSTAQHSTAQHSTAQDLSYLSLWLCRYQAQPLSEEVLLQEQQRAEGMLQAASAGIAPTAQNLPQDSSPAITGVTAWPESVHAGCHD